MSMILLKLKSTFFLRKGKRKSTVQNVFLFYFFTEEFLKLLAALHGMWDLSSPTRDQTRTLSSGSIAS